LQHCGIELCYLLISLDGIIAYVGNKQSETHDMTRKQPSASGPVLIVEDDKNTASLVAVYLEKEGFKAIQAYDGRQALELARLHNPVLIILDLMLPKMDGLEVCKELRRSSDVPILMLTARGEEIDRILGLSLGADDYMVKPFSPRELVARVKAILRRAKPDLSKPTGSFIYKDLQLDIEKHRVSLKGQPVSLTASEFKLLCMLIAAPGRVYLREELLSCLYPDGEAVIDRVIDVHISNLRQKIEEDPSRPQYILTVRGIGYKFADGE
jgi:DNA-binding response OmpR family regulator